MRSVAIAFVSAVALSGCGQSTTTQAQAPAASAASSLPADCDAYLKAVNACVEKSGAGNPAIATFKSQMDDARNRWAAVQDKATLAPACKQMLDSWKQVAASVKC